MTRAAALLGLSLAGLMLRGVVAEYLPAVLVPDLGLVMAVAAGLHLGSLGALVVAFAVGLVGDLLSGSLLGQQALVLMSLAGVTSVADRQLQLKRGLPLAVFTAGGTVAAGALLVASTSLFEGRLVPDAGLAVGLLLHAAANAAVAPPLAAAVGRLLPEPAVRGGRGPAFPAEGLGR